MKNSSLIVFSIIKNIEKNINKNIVDINNIFKPVSKIWFERTNNYYKDACKKIYNDIENNYYNHNDLAITLLYEMIYNKKINFFDINHKKIKEVKSMMNKQQLEKDKNLIVVINKQINLKNVNDFFKINEDGLSIVYHLIKDKNISPIFFIYFMNKGLTVQKENIIILDEYIRFEIIIQILDKILFNKP
jgi:DNA primase large subunit